MIPFRVAGCYTPGMRGVSFEVSAADRQRLAAVVAARQSAKACLEGGDSPGLAEGCGTAESCAGPGCRSPASGAGSDASSKQASMACCGTRPASPHRRRCPRRRWRRWSSEPWRSRPARPRTRPAGRWRRPRLGHQHGAEDLARPRPAAAPAAVVQAQPRPGVRRQGARCRRLYVDPPAHAVVLSVDEKSQIQALDRTQPGLPMKKGRAGTMTHDYIRNGTTTLFAALNVLDGSVVGQCMQRHRHQEFLRFLNRLEREIPAGKLVHVVLDNYGSHKHPKVRAWLERHPRWTFHYTPTSASWLNAVETFFARLTQRRLKRGVFHSLDRQPRCDHRRRQARVPNVEFDPLG